MKILHQTQKFLKGNEKSKDQYHIDFLSHDKFYYEIFINYNFSFPLDSYDSFFFDIFFMP